MLLKRQGLVVFSGHTYGAGCQPRQHFRTVR
jgi:hypothetical protein